MQTAGYTTTNSGRYPLSTQTLDFIQAQIMLLQQLGLVGGKRYILRAPDGTNTGLVYLDGELLTVAATPALSNSTKYLIVRTTTEDIHADGDTYTEARRYRTAYLSTSNNGATESYELSKFATLESNTTLSEKIRQMPNVVLEYLQDILAEKMPLLTIEGMTVAQLNAIKTPCVANCKNSIKVVANAANYNLSVVLMGDTVRQEITVPSGSIYARTFANGNWSPWLLLDENLHIEVKIVKGTVYLRHGELPTDTSIVLLRKKRRSAYRRTGGASAYSQNRGKREPRAAKTQYVHYKGIVLSKGEPNKWYVPRCISVSNAQVDGNMINREINGCCRELVRQVSNDSNGNEVYKMQGVRNIITCTNGRHCQHHGYVPIAVQVARLNVKGQLTTKESGGEMVYMRYALRRKRVRTGRTMVDPRTHQTVYVLTWVYYRNITLGQ